MPDNQNSPTYNFGLPGLKQASGFLFEEWQRELSGERGRRTIREMIDTSAVVGAGLLAIEILLRQVHFETIPADKSKAAGDVAQFVDECRHDMACSWADFIAEHLGFLPWGWQMHEIEYKFREGPQPDMDYQAAQGKLAGKTAPPRPSSKFNDGKYGWHQFGIRGQESLLRWEFTPDGHDLLGMWQQPAPTYQTLFVPLAKSMNFRTTIRLGNPEGRSILRNAWQPFRFGQNTQIVEGIGLERDLAGMLKIGVPPEWLQSNPTADDAASLSYVKEMARNVRRDEQEGIIYPLLYDEDGNDLFKIDLVTSGGTRQFNTDEIVGRHEQRILLSMLSDFLLIGHEGVGSRALIDPRMDLFSLTGEAYLGMSVAHLNRKAVTQLLTLNRIDLALAPEIRAGRINLSSLLNLSKALLAISQAEVAQPLAPDIKTRLLERMDLPTADSGATMEQQQPNDQPPAAGGAGGGPDAREQPEQPEAPEQPAKAAVWPAHWPDRVQQRAEELLKQRPGDLSPRVWAEIVLSQAQATMREYGGHASPNGKVVSLP